MKKTVLFGSFLLSTAVCLSAGYSLAEGYFGAKFMSAKEAKSKWGSAPFDAKSFKKSSEKIKGAMATEALEKKTLVGQDMLKVRELMGDPDSYFFSDTIYAYQITENVKPGEETWQLVFLPDPELKLVKDVKIHKKCCYKTPDWAK